MVTASDHNELKDRVLALEEQIKDLIKINKEKDAEINHLQTQVNKIQENNIPAVNWPKLPKQAAVVITNMVTKENKALKTKEKNLIITGVKMPESQVETEKKQKDEEAVALIFEKIVEEADKEKIERKYYKITRFKNKEEGKPGVILVEFDEIETKLKIQSSAKKLMKIEEYNKVYINKDSTKNEMENEKLLRDDRRKRNELLDNTDGKGFKFGYHRFQNDKEVSKFFWGIRIGEIKKIKYIERE